ncbi:hypothetical protein [Nocardia sp. NPDC003345]
MYVSDEGTYVVQGWTTDRQGTVEIPHLLPAFAEPNTFIGATMIDTGRGTFTLSGRAVKEPEALAQLQLAEDESVIEVPKRERSHYGAASAG